MSFFSLSIKSFFTPEQQPRGSAHSKAFAAQTHPNRGRVPRFGYFEREKVSAWELSDVRVLRSQNTDCRKNEVFRQSQRTPSGVLFACLYTKATPHNSSGGALRKFCALTLLQFHGNTSSITAKLCLVSTQNSLANHSCSIMRYCPKLKCSC